jgi:hypothetical protein
LTSSAPLWKDTLFAVVGRSERARGRVGRLLKYAIVLALAVAIGAYIVLGPLSLDDILPSRAEQKAAAFPIEPTPPASPASVDEELDYMVAKQLASLEGWRAFLAAHPNGAYAQSARAEIEKRPGADNAAAEAPVASPASAPMDNERVTGVAQRLGSLASYAQSASAQVERLLVAEEAPAPASAAVSNAAPLDTRVATPSTDPVSPPSGNAASGADAEAVSNDPSPDAKAVNEAARPARPASPPARPASPPAGTDVAAGTEIAALTPDEICQRDGEHLARLRSNPSSDEAARFANELACEELRPQVRDLMESLSNAVPAPAAADAPNVAPPGAQAVGEAGRPAAPLVGVDVASAASDEACKRDEGRLAQLRVSPSGEEIQRFASEIGCGKLRPQLQRLMESLGLAPPAQLARANSSPSDSSLQAATLAKVCASERAALDRLREGPSPGAARLFWRDLQCERLRPQVRLLMESLNIALEPLGSTAAPGESGVRGGASSDAPAQDGADPSACREETAELNRIRATPDLREAKRFASAVTCAAVKPQAARLLESLAE